MKQALIYSSKVWLTSSIISPLLYTALSVCFLFSNHINPFHDPFVYNRLQLRFIKMIEGTWMLMIPLAIGIYYSVLYMSKHLISIFSIKCYLSFIGIIFATLPISILLFEVLYSNENSVERTITITGIFHGMECYALSVLFAIWLYKLRLVKDNTPHFS